MTGSRITEVMERSQRWREVSAASAFPARALLASRWRTCLVLVPVRERPAPHEPFGVRCVSTILAESVAGSPALVDVSRAGERLSWGLLS